jgi:hypothetical protein
MPYRVTGIGLEPLEYEKATLAEAAYLASKMADNGVAHVRVFDEHGREITPDELDAAWTRYFGR